MVRTNYDTAAWRKRFKRYAKRGGRGAHRRWNGGPAYVAFRRRFNGRKGLNKHSGPRRFRRGTKKKPIGTKQQVGSHAKNGRRTAFPEAVEAGFLKAALRRARRGEDIACVPSGDYVTARARDLVFEEMEDAKVIPAYLFAGSRHGEPTRLPHSAKYFRALATRHPTLWDQLVEAINARNEEAREALER